MEKSYVAPWQRVDTSAPQRVVDKDERKEMHNEYYKWLSCSGALGHGYISNPNVCYFAMHFFFQIATFFIVGMVGHALYLFFEEEDGLKTIAECSMFLYFLGVASMLAKEAILSYVPVTRDGKGSFFLVGLDVATFSFILISVLSSAILTALVFTNKNAFLCGKRFGDSGPFSCDNDKANLWMDGDTYAVNMLMASPLLQVVGLGMIIAFALESKMDKNDVAPPKPEPAGSQRI